MLLCLIGWIWLSADLRSASWWEAAGFGFLLLLNAGTVCCLSLCRITINEGGIGSRIPGIRSATVSSHGRMSARWASSAYSTASG